MIKFNDKLRKSKILITSLNYLIPLLAGPLELGIPFHYGETTYLPCLGSQAAIMFLASNICWVSSGTVRALYCWLPLEVKGANPGMKKWRRGKGTIFTANLRRSAFNWPVKRNEKRNIYSRDLKQSWSVCFFLFRPSSFHSISILRHSWVWENYRLFICTAQPSGTVALVGLI